MNLTFAPLETSLEKIFNPSGPEACLPDSLKNTRSLIRFNGKEGLLYLKGNSTFGDPVGIYSPVTEIIDDYFSANSRLRCFFNFRQLDKEVTRALFVIFKKLSIYQKSGKAITITWFADWYNREMIETGIDLGELFDLEINISSL